MDRSTRTEVFDQSPIRNMRSPSISSDVMSTSTKSVGAGASVPLANPPPAYVAQDEASKIISTELERAVTLSPSALTMVNEFLDHVLYNILYTSHSMSLSQLKAAIPSVLKPRLGKAALRVAEEELKEYLDEEEEAELSSKKAVFQPQLDFDTDLVWKVARLRCMVYARLGDLEEEDEDEWLDKEQLLEQVAEAQKRSKQPLEVGPGAAIFLAAVIEYLGEQALHYAAQHAQKRHDSAKTSDEQGGENGSLTPSTERDVILLDGKDMNHVGRDSPLSRLWRSWRRNTRSGNETSSRPMSPEVLRAESPKTARSTSSGALPPIPPIAEEYNNGVNGFPAQPSSPSQIPLPMNEHDVDEIEGREMTGQATPFIKIPERSKKRPTSMYAMPGRFPSYTTQPDSPGVPEPSELNPLRPQPERKRSLSMPTVATPFANPEAEAPAEAHAQTTSRDVSEKEVAPGTDPEVVNASTEQKKNNEPDSSQQVDGKRDEDGHTKQSGLIDGTLAAITGALGAVGVHHIVEQDPPRPRTSSRPSSRLARNVSEDGPPVTAASISGPADFENMHIPMGRDTPNNSEITQQDRDLADGAIPGLPSLTDRPLSPPTRPDSGHRSSPDVLKADSRSNQQRHSGSGHYAVTLPVVSETHSVIDPSQDAAPYPHVRKFTPSPRVSNTTIPERGSSLEEINQPRHAASASRSSQASHHSKSSSSSSRLLGFTRDGQGRPQTIHQQRAAGDMPDDIRAAHSTTPTSRSRSRPQTSGSPTEQKRQHERMTSDSSQISRIAPPTLEEAKRSLEVLINSDETLHYTLTPQAAEFPQDQLAAIPNKRSATQDLADFFRNTAPPGQEVPIKSDRAVKDTKRSVPASIPLANQTEAVATARETSTPQKQRLRVGEPRDPQIHKSSSTRDLADYARSTGPMDDTQLPKALGGNMRLPNGTVAKPAVPSVVGEQTAKSPSTTKSQNRFKLQARDARPPRNAETSDLIDFIREGPPRAPGEHRVDRHVAPFRTTMDSDDLNALAPNTDVRGNYRASDTSTVDTHVANSVDTSVNSRTPLVNRSAMNGVGIAISGPTRHQPINEDEDMMPKRTRRRVKDPYAIDDSDDEVDEELQTSLKQNEESLIDFLRNTAPPPGMTAQPLLSTPPGTSDTTVQRSPSGARLREVLRGGQSSTPPSDKRSDSLKRSARAESPHLTQVGSKLDSYKPTHATHAAHVDRNRNRSRSGGDENLKGSYGETADLAEYLRNTGPPAGKEYVPQPFILSSAQQNQNGVSPAAKEEVGFKKFFSLKQKMRN